LRIFLLTTLVFSSFAIAEDATLKEALDEFFTAQAEQMNEDLPAMVDEISRLDRVDYSDLTFTHFYTVVGLSDAEFKQEYPADVLKDFYSIERLWTPTIAKRDGRWTDLRLRISIRQRREAGRSNGHSC
jgi:hypothetical protein